MLGPEFYGGVDLSGGQWQRVALARAFLRDARLIILDEPTASLDPRSEVELFSRVRELFAGRTVVLISHRFASVRMADHIYVLDRGRIVEHGSHLGAHGRGRHLRQPVHPPGIGLRRRRAAHAAGRRLGIGRVP